MEKYDHVSLEIKLKYRLEVKIFKMSIVNCYLINYFVKTIIVRIGVVQSMMVPIENIV